ncbi:unnamed protein product [Meloidogyne enterolobii]|uniref:Uncharacterized protein n=1 Tax=Meloidogyne enterolobii TaxID=390850 RepID=A0ACB0Z0C0_MELEN
MSPTTSSNISQEEDFKSQLERQITSLTEELGSKEANNAKLMERYEEEYKKLLEDRAENEMLSEKIKLLNVSLGDSEGKLKGFKNDSEKEDQALGVRVDKFRKTSAEHNKHLHRIFETLKSMRISDEDHYGDMSKFKQELRQKIDGAKSGCALASEESKQKKEVLANLDVELFKVDQNQITTEIKSEITETTINILKSRRKKLLDLKMSNHSLKTKLAQMKDMGQE